MGWDETICPDPATCAKNCAVGAAGSEYTSTYGVTASGSDLKLGFVTQGPYSKNVGSRNYLMEDETTYKMFKLKNKEFTFDVDVSKLPCGFGGRRRNELESWKQSRRKIWNRLL